MKRRVMYAAAVAALLLVGAGCAGQQQTTAGLNAAGEQQIGKETKADAGATADGTVDAILKDSEAEKTAQQEHAADAADVNADDSAINAYSEGSYDIK